MGGVQITVNDELDLSQLTEDDLDDLVHHISDPDIYANTLTIPSPYTKEDARAFLEQAKSFIKATGIQKDWSIRYHGRVIGGIGVLYNHGLESHKSEIGYWISREYRGQGITTACIDALIRYLFSHTSLIRLEANVFVGNIASARTLEKNGFIREGTARSTFIKEGKPRDTWVYALVKERVYEFIG